MEPQGGGDDGRPLVEWAFRQASMSFSVFGVDQRYLRLNDMAVRLMGIEEDVLRGRVFPDGVPAGVDRQGTVAALRDVAATGEPCHYEGHARAPSEVHEHAWSLELWPVRDPAGEICAVAMAAFDSSEQYRARQRLAVLDEAAVSIGTTLDLDRTARELAALVVPQFADFASVDLLAPVVRGEEPATGPPDAAVVLHRVAHVSTVEGSPEPVIGPGAVDTYPAYSPPARALHLGRTVHSGRGEADFERWMASMPSEARNISGLAITSLMAVPLIARDTTLGVAVLFRTRPDPFDEDDFALARELTSRAAVCLDNARRYSRERITALTLQETLLPHRPPRQSAVDVAFRYLPSDSRAGIGGDWFDVIPLSGSRVALVVGDVAGHGIHASATMGRLRTAVQTLADVDLPPDELLAHLDDLVLRLGSDGECGHAPSSEVGATCLYAVYDPVARALSVASAGHLPPVLVLPDGTTNVVEVNAGPVLGVGGLPFEATELELPEGTLVALFSDGLVDAAGQDPDVGTARLGGILADPHTSLEGACDDAFAALLPERPADDIALVLARTRALDATHVRVWDLAPDFSEVATARKNTVAQLDAWGLTDVGFVTELVVSELVTNAIRYGSAPVQLRLIHDDSLICEVSDGSSTSPHLRRARIFDEGGRGLLLVAQLTNRWGTRHTPTGKTIWTEQALN
ncbi:SpoIIE family protein phosphatase [Streptomyces sp. NPDC059378]|uniref:SpoIIE family protein phosphatase n=1 Tax=Streptomyces sp. NPDC059378 TaxID=3346815 RepID=UPI003684EDE2